MIEPKQGTRPGAYQSIASMTSSTGDVFSMSESEVDALPYGVITLDRDGTILGYNDFQVRMAHLTKERVMGRNFFTDVAPCTSVADFKGRFDEFVASSQTSANFDFTFKFAWGAQLVSIQFLRASSSAKDVKMLINEVDRT